MKCIKCDADNKLQDRKLTIGRCKVCKHRFVFDPKLMSGVDFTDRFFQQALDDLSIHNSLFFTERQFYYFFNRRLNLRKWHPLKKAGCGGLIASVILTFFLNQTVGFSALWFIPALVGGVVLLGLAVSSDMRKALGWNRSQNLDIPLEQVATWYSSWTKVNGPARKLLQPPAQKSEAANISPELKKYSFDRALVCEQTAIAQCLIANNFHFEHNCAVLSIDGYPHDIFSTVMQMLRSNPSLSVYALHDASIPGLELIHKLSTSAEWFAGGTAKIYDLGLTPRQILNRSVFVERTYLDLVVPAHVAATLQPEEVRWLEAGNHVSLESFTPAMLMRVAANGIAKSRDPQSNDALVPVSAQGDVGGIYIYGFDTFG